MSNKKPLAVLFLSACVVAGMVALQVQAASTPKAAVKKTSVSGVVKFTSTADFKNYLAKSRNVTGGGGFGMSRSGGLALPTMALEAAPAPSAFAANSKSDSMVGSAGATQYSQTNVQVAGIDEPDIVKTDGQSIFFSQQGYGYMYDYMPSPTLKVGSAEAVMPPGYQSGGTRVIDALPAQDAKVDFTISKTGQLLLSGNNLLVFDYDKVYGYDVTDRSNPKQVWSVKYENSNSMVSARLSNGKIYLVTKGNIRQSAPCPMQPLSANGTMIAIPCTGIYHPVSPVPSPVVFTAFVINPSSGAVENKVSFVGSDSQPLVYMSDGSLYVTYALPEQTLKLMIDFLKQRAQDLVPGDVIARLDRLNGYDISDSSKLNEMTLILDQYESGLSDDDRSRMDTELQNRMQDFAKAHKRDLGQTGIVRINLGNFAVAASGSVPGTPLNQFSLDEYQGYLRVATTVGGNWSSLWRMGRVESANDVYVLDGNLKTAGQIQDLGVTERIYSARFIGDRGYLVTFRQTDPFYVLDLSRPSAPVMAGELKIPGFSSYLHPLAPNRILGVGMENSKVKLSLFDVSDPKNPSEISKYSLDAYWTDVSNDHHVFLQDERHHIFFIPGGDKGYVLSYEGDQIKLNKVISSIQAKRAVYVGDYLYILGSDKMVVVDEQSWDKVKEVSLD